MKTYIKPEISILELTIEEKFAGGSCCRAAQGSNNLLCQLGTAFSGGNIVP